MNYYKHESAYVDEPVDIGEWTKIWHFSNIQRGTTIVKNCVFGQNVNVGNNVSIYEGVTLEDYVFCGPSMVFTNILDPRCKYPQVGSKFYVKTLIKEGASLGANCTIVCGNTIGNNAIVGASATVTKDVPDFALVLGTPAKVVDWVSETGKKLDFDDDGFAFCEKLKKKYKLENSKVIEFE